MSMPIPIGSEISVIQKISVAIIHERNVEKLLENVLGILESELGMLRGTFALLFGDTLKIEASRGLDESEKQNGQPLSDEQKQYSIELFEQIREGDR